MYGNRAWVRDHPVATKRFLRAVFKAAEFCQADPVRAARRLVDGGVEPAANARSGQAGTVRASNQTKRRMLVTRLASPDFSQGVAVAGSRAVRADDRSAVEASWREVAG